MENHASPIPFNKFFATFFDVTILWYVVINYTATLPVRWKVPAAQESK